MMSFGLQSLICFDSSPMVYCGLTVVAMAPRVMTENKVTGYWIKLGAKMRTTSCLVIRSEKGRKPLTCRILVD